MARVPLIGNESFVLNLETFACCVQSCVLNTFLYLNIKFMLQMNLNTEYFLQIYLNTKYIDVFKYFCK